MCPDAELLSAWTDGEVPQPWRDRVASHVAGCEACSQRVSTWRGLSVRLQTAGRVDEAAIVERIGVRLEGAIAEGRSKARPAVSGPSGLVGKARSGSRFFLPLPLAAAAALALLLLGGLSGGLVANLAKASQAKLPAAATSFAATNSPNMESLVRYLEAQNAPLNITIQLPAVGSSQMAGEPTIIRTPPIETVALPPSGGSFSTTDNQGK